MDIISRKMLFIMLCAASIQGAAQRITDQRIDFKIHQQPVGDALIQLSQTAGIAIGFGPDIAEKKAKVSCSAHNERIADVLNTLLKHTDIEWRETNGQVLLRIRPVITVISGFVEDAENGERLVGATITDLTAQKSVTTNNYGYFSLTVARGTATRLTAQYPGYEKKSFQITTGTSNKIENVLLQPLTNLSEVIISDQQKKEDNNSDLFFSQKEQQLVRLPINELPAPGGERDLMRAAAYLPGISTDIDGLGGWSVRGGDLDQNRVIVDDALLFNAGHAFGLFSTIAPDAIRFAQLWKGDAPARLGGSTASVMDVRTKEGNLFRPAATASFGWMTGHLQVESPIVKERSAAIFSVRKSFSYPYIRQKVSERWSDQVATGQSDLGFYDMNFKINWSLGQKNRLYLSLFDGQDHLRDSVQTIRKIIFDGPFDPPYDILIHQRMEKSWRNQLASLRWNHLLSEKCFINTTFTTSRFDLKSHTRQAFSFWGTPVLVESQALSQSQLRDFSAKTDLDWWISAHLAIQAGAQYSLTKVLPFYVTGSEGLQEQVSWVEYDGATQQFVPSKALQYERGHTALLYGEGNWVIKKGTRLRVGARVESFLNQGKIFLMPQPRIYFEKNYANGFSFQAGWNEMAQTLHTVSPSPVESVTELWLISSPEVQPQRSTQASAGIGWRNSKRSVRVEGYAKYIRHLEAYSYGWYSSDTAYDSIRYKDGIRDWGEELVFGKGRAVGMEVLAEQHSGPTTGWITLHIGRSERNYGQFNASKWYPARFDRLWLLKMVVLHRFNRHFSATLAATASSGDAILPIQFNYDGKLRLIDLHSANISYFIKNTGAYRQPAQLRMDAGFNYTFHTGAVSHQLALGAYNALNTRNRHYTFQVVSEIVNDGAPETRIIYGLPLLPYLTWKISWQAKENKPGHRG